MQELINNLVSSWAEGEFWHERSSLSCFMLGYRGLGRWHCAESCDDSKARKEISKYVIDNYKIFPVIDNGNIQKAINYTLTDRNQLESHLSQWLAREDKFIKDAKFAIGKLSATQDYTIYRMLCDYLADVENERLYVNILLENFRYNSFAPHHVSIIMMMLHKYFEEDYKGGRIDFSIT